MSWPLRVSSDRRDLKLHVVCVKTCKVVKVEAHEKIFGRTITCRWYWRKKAVVTGVKKKDPPVFCLRPSLQVISPCFGFGFPCTLNHWILTLDSLSSSLRGVWYYFWFLCFADSAHTNNPKKRMNEKTMTQPRIFIILSWRSSWRPWGVNECRYVHPLPFAWSTLSGSQVQRCVLDTSACPKVLFLRSRPKKYVLTCRAY